jgi:beta-glucanase (GH16 family)
MSTTRIDGQPVYSTTLGVPHTPHYLILTAAVGGTWPGNPDETTVFPQYHDIDYVRVYQKDGYFKP